MPYYIFINNWYPSLNNLRKIMRKYMYIRRVVRTDALTLVCIWGVIYLSLAQR